MSYILDALKKSDRERQQENPLDLHHLYEAQPQAGTGFLRQGRWSWLLFGAVLALVGLPFWVWIHWQGENGQNREAAVSSASRPADLSAQAPAEPTSPDPPSAAFNKVEFGRMGVETARFEDRFPSLSRGDFSLPAGEKTEPAALYAAGSDDAARRTVRPVKIRREREKVVVALQETTVIPAAEAPPVLRRADQVPVAGRPPVAVGVTPPSPAAASAAGASQPARLGKAAEKIPYLHELPPQVQAEIPTLQFAGHAYSPEPSRRLIIINGMIRREGDQIDAETRLMEITWEGVIVDRKGFRFQVRCS